MSGVDQDLTDDTGAHPFNERLWGPEGWTQPQRDMLGAYLTGLTHGGLEEFCGVPAETAKQATAAVVDIDDDTRSPLKASDIAELTELLGGDVTFCGYAVEPARGDERIEFTCAQLDVTDMPPGRLTALCELLTNSDRAVERLDTPEGTTLQVW